MKKKVLTVDDSRTIRNMLLVTLNNAGFETIQAEDGVEGLEVLEECNPDVIVTDINMPRLDGFGFIEGVRRNEKYRAVPILVLTTESQGGKMNEGKRRRKEEPRPSGGCDRLDRQAFRSDQTDRCHRARNRLKPRIVSYGYERNQRDLFPGMRGAARRTGVRSSENE
mgnify:CR=1 FL=1